MLLEAEGWKRTAAVAEVAAQTKCSTRHVQKAISGVDATCEDVFRQIHKAMEPGGELADSVGLRFGLEILANQSTKQDEK